MYTTIRDVIEHFVLPSLDCPEDYDVEGIARACSDFNGKAFDIIADGDDFWDIVEEHQIEG